MMKMKMPELERPIIIRRLPTELEKDDHRLDRRERMVRELLVISAVVAAALALFACSGGPAVGECHEINPVLVSNENNQLVTLNCECWTGKEWMAGCELKAE